MSLTKKQVQEAAKKGVEMGRRVQPVGMGMKSVIAKAFRKVGAPQIENALDRKYRIQDAAIFAEQKLKNLRKRKK